MTDLAFTANGIDVSSIRVVMPLSGCFYGDFETTDASVTLQDTALAIVLPGLGLNAYAVRSQQVEGFQKVRFVGGFAGGYNANVLPQGYNQATYQQIANTILTTAGEWLSPTSTPAVMQQTAPFWAIFGKQTVSQQLDLIARSTASDWRVLPDGSAWFGTETWLPSTLTAEDFSFEMQWPERQQCQYGVNAFSVLPGQTFDGLQVSCVEHVATQDMLRSVVTYV